MGSVGRGVFANISPLRLRWRPVVCRRRRASRPP